LTGGEPAGPRRAERLAGVVLAAGHGTRLRPLTDTVPKALVPVNGEPLLDLALGHVVPLVDEAAVNAHAHADQVIAHLRERWPRVHISHERNEPLGTAGALGALHDWIDGRDVLVHNVDAWHRADLGALMVDGWERDRIRLLVVDRPPARDFGPWQYAGVALMPWHTIERLEPVPTGLYEVLWRDAAARGEIDLVPYDGPWFDCGTHASYRDANLAASTA
jgi:MurNAc alpha-1-phosphate uridylyltransferase